MLLIQKLLNNDKEGWGHMQHALSASHCPLRSFCCLLLLACSRTLHKLLGSAALNMQPTYEHVNKISIL